MSAKLAKPQLRGLLNSQIKKNLIVAGVLCVVAVVSFKTLYNDVKKKKYADFYKNYDAEKAYERMAAAGLLQSGPQK